MPLLLRVHERKRRIEELGVPFDLIPDLIGLTESDLRRWMAGSMSVEESDVVEVGFSLLEMRLGRLADGCNC